MKKILTGLVLGSLLVGLMAPALVLAQPPAQATQCCEIYRGFSMGGEDYVTGNTVGPVGADCDPAAAGTDLPTVGTADWGLVCLVNSVNRVTDWAFYILIVISVIFIIIGGFTFMTAAGDPEKASKGRSYIIYAIIGIVVGILARIVPAIVIFLVG